MHQQHVYVAAEESKQKERLEEAVSFPDLTCYRATKTEEESLVRHAQQAKRKELKFCLPLGFPTEKQSCFQPAEKLSPVYCGKT